MPILSMLRRTLLTALILLPVLPAGANPLPDPLNQRVVDFAKANLGAHIGNGQCAALAAQALRAAGASPRQAGGYPTQRDYVWGRQVLLLEGTPAGSRASGGELADVQPGDIAQFSNAQFIKAHFGHHTAIVEGIQGKHLLLLQQNIGGRQYVAEGAVRVDKLMNGWVRFYRPVPAP